MRYAIFSDVHANLIAWDAVLEDIGHCQADVLICLGDVVGYGPRPMEVLESVLAATPNILMGNHDAAAVGAMDYSIFNEQAQHSTEWTARALNQEARAYLLGLPLAMESEGLFFVHAETCQPDRFDYVNDPEQALENFLAANHRITFMGHTHCPKIFEWSGEGEVEEFAPENRSLDPEKRYIVNVGSVGEPRDADDPRARYVIYDTARRSLEFRAVAFDIPAYRRDLATTTLGVKPHFLRVFEHTVGEHQESLAEEAPAGRLQLTAGETPGLGHVQLGPRPAQSRLAGATAMARPGLAGSGRGGRKGKGRLLALLSLLVLLGGLSWLIIPRLGRNQSVTGAAPTKESPPLVNSEPRQKQQGVPSTPEAASPKPVDEAPVPGSEPPRPGVVNLPLSNSTLKLSTVAVGDRAPSLNSTFGSLELAYNFGYGGEKLSQDGISFASVTLGHVSSPVFGTTRGITVQGFSTGASPDFNFTDLGEDLWQTIAYTDRGDGLQLKITGLDAAKTYLFQILLGEPREKRWTRYENGLITVTDSAGASQSIQLNYGHEVGDYALLAIELAASDSLLFDMPKAVLGPGVSGIVIHSTTPPG